MLDKNTILEALKLRDKGKTYREIRSVCDIGSSSITRAKKIFHETGMSLEELSEIPEEEFLEIFYPSSSTGRDLSKELPDFERIYQRLHDKTIHTTLSDEWYLYAHLGGNSESKYGHSQFNYHYRKWLQETIRVKVL